MRIGGFAEEHERNLWAKFHFLSVIPLMKHVILYHFSEVLLLSWYEDDKVVSKYLILF